MNSESFPTGSLEERLRVLEERQRVLEDIEAIRTLMARYHEACDGWDEKGTHKDPAAVAALFTEDGVWDDTARQPPPTGPGEIAALAKDLQSIHRIAQFDVNSTISVDGDTAVGTFKGVLRFQLRESSRLGWSIGQYRIVAQRTSDGWRFQLMTWEPITDKGRFDPDARPKSR